jgi:hypothetical protein
MLSPARKKNIALLNLSAIFVFLAGDSINFFSATMQNLNSFSVSWGIKILTKRLLPK